MESAVVLPVPLGEHAHVALLAPFVDDPDVGVEEELRFFFAHIDAMDLELSRDAGAVSVVAADAVEGLRTALALRWPGTRAAGEMRVTDAALSRLPRRVRAGEAALWVRDGDTWTEAATFRLADPE